MPSPHIDTEKQWSQITMQFVQVQLQMKQELDRMVERNVNLKIIEKQQALLNNLIEAVSDANVLFNGLNHICSLQHSRGRLQQAVLHQASKAETPDQAFQIIKTFTDL